MTRSRAAAALLTVLSSSLLAQGGPPAGAPGGGRSGQQQPATPPLTSSPLPTGRVTYRTLTEANLEMERIEAASRRVEVATKAHAALKAETDRQLADLASREKHLATELAGATEARASARVERMTCLR